ncbi:MAG: hypothetical protein AAB875_06880 [Patescibacteria group bacterium]
MSRKEVGRSEVLRWREQKRNASKRRWFLKVAGASVVVGGGAIALALYENKFGRPADRELIMSEAEKRGIQPSENERRLWEDAYKNTFTRIEPNQESFDLVAERFEDTLERMLQSENPYFNQAANGFIDQLEAGEVKIHSVYGAGTNIWEGLGYNVRISDMSTEKLLVVSHDFVLNESSGLSLAHAITHEWMHYQRAEAFFQSLPQTLSQSEINLRFQEYGNQPSRGLTEETYAYAHEAEAYIYQAGLLGELYDVKTTGADDRAANYILSGKSPEGQAWQTYLASILHN